MTLNWPWWQLLLMIGVQAWPVSLGVAAGLLTMVALTRGWVRWTALVAALPCLAVAAVGAWWAVEAWQHDREAVAFESQTHEVLDQDQVVNGFHLPAGIAVQWQDTGHRQLRMASPPSPVMLLGLRASWMELADDGEDWDLQLPEPELIEGWTCEQVGVRMSPAGQLRSCRLAAGRAWQGWPIPAGSLLDLATAGKVGLALPTGASMAAPEIGHRVTDTGGFAFNADGSLDQFYFEDEDPLLVAGKRLWNTVQWSYDPATYGQGRRRRALTVRGALASAEGGVGGDVVIRLVDGRVTAAE